MINLVKSEEKTPREILLAEAFKAAIDYINAELPERLKVKYLHYDMKKALK